MSDTAVHFSDAAVIQQEAKGVETGFDVKEPLVFLKECASAWKENTNLNVQLLRALCQLSISDSQKAKIGFTSQELVEEISTIRGRVWSNPSDKEQMSDDIRQQWNKLLKTWETKSEGIAQQFSDSNFPYLPKLSKTEGGGTGKLTLHRIEWVPPEIAPTPPEPDCTLSGDNQRTTAIRYVCEDIEEANPLAKIFTRGVRLKGWRRQLYIVVLAAPLLMLWLLFVQVLFGITLPYSIGDKNIFTSLLSLGVVYWAVFATVGPLYKLGSDNIALAPWWMQSIDDDRLLERRAPPRHPEKSIKAVRYVAKCPVCGGKVAATKGRLEFLGRIVGRCEEAPVEHVFSFDHVTRNGRSLR